SLMFLRRIEQKTIRKRRLRNLLLLLLRCAALFLLAFAFSRPYFTGANSSAPSSGSESSVILIDTSYSMRYGDVFSRGRQAARNLIDAAPPGAQFAIVRFAGGYDVAMPMKADHNEARVTLEQIQPGLGATDYLQAVQAA